MQFRMNQDSPRNEIGDRQTGHSGNRRWGRVLACLVAITALATLGRSVQNQGNNANGQPYIPSAEPPPDALQQMEMRDQQSNRQSFDPANAERKKQIADDSAQLLKLATELKAEVDKTTKDTLSLNVIRKADEIEKLAHSVKEKLKLTIGGS